VFLLVPAHPGSPGQRAVERVVVVVVVVVVVARRAPVTCKLSCAVVLKDSRLRDVVSSQL